MIGRNPNQVPVNGFLGTMATEDKVNYYSKADTLAKLVDVPATASSTGVKGQYAVESGFLYICVATDTWERVAIATWP